MKNKGLYEDQLRCKLICEIGSLNNLDTNDLISLYRKRNGLSQIEFGKLCDINNSYISQIETYSRNLNPKISQKFIQGMAKITEMKGR